MSTHHYSPSVGDFVVSALSTDSNPQLLPYRVTRVNYSTGRGTVRHTVTNRALQVVRGRFSWSLADGTRRPVQFAVPSELPHADTAGVGHSDSPRVGDLMTPMVPGNALSDDPDHIWEVAEVAPSGTWALARRADDRSQCLLASCDSLGAYRIDYDTRIWFVTPVERQPVNARGWISYTGMSETRHKSGVLVTWSLRENGRFIGTMFCHMRPDSTRWESAYSEDMPWSTRTELAESMLSPQGRQLREAKREATLKAAAGD